MIPPGGKGMPFLTFKVPLRLQTSRVLGAHERSQVERRCREAVEDVLGGLLHLRVIEIFLDAREDATERDPQLCMTPFRIRTL